MNDINHTIVIGRLVRDGDFGYIPSGTARLNISIAVNESRKGQNGWTECPNYFDVTIWGKTAENLKPYLLKGKQVAIEGHLQQQRWEKDGQKFSKIVIIADNVELCGGRDNAGSGGNQQPVQQQVPEYDNGGEFSEDIPF